ncbi:ribosome biogenesis GTPase YlqF [Alicyclobacillus acidiphilus]|uniref:ribosome biogenesis GTPase YlqF n=1 Tax=Alicyclobacillus acidiphilus TaxID=182455 RepID=UPI0008330BDF|nr:ribosome biogenesis GTPase YlqF [Alicyclobacillus acidiphilus]
MQVHWYPGHMAKARRMMETRIRQVDCVIELVDARLPVSSRNPVLEELSTRRPSVIVMTRSDLADPAATEAWQNYFRAQGIDSIAVNVLSGDGLGLVKDSVHRLTQPKVQRDRARGLRRSIVRAMVVGIPNVGKSSFINQIAKRSIAKTGNKPGVTRSEQWVKLGDIELLDTPGVLWPKIDTPEQGLRLAVSGAIKDQIYDVEEAAVYFICYAIQRYPELLKARFDLDSLPDVEWSDVQTVWPVVEDVFTQIGKRRGMLARGGEVDVERVSKMLVKEAQDGQLGRMSLEWPEES